MGEQTASIRPILPLDLYRLCVLRVVPLRGDPAAKEQGREMGLSDQILERRILDPGIPRGTGDQGICQWTRIDRAGTISTPLFAAQGFEQNIWSGNKLLIRFMETNVDAVTAVDSFNTVIDFCSQSRFKSSSYSMKCIGHVLSPLLS